jgi:D-glycero-D-manno-heptose 1,7-bisphosphate phosphatase
MSLVLLDRDGVINEDSTTYIKRPSEWFPIPGSLEAIARLHRAGRSVAICSNQAGVARGLFSQADLDAIHGRMLTAIARMGGHINGIFCCTHAPDQHCSCRKPAPGLLTRAMRELNATPDDTTVIGDSLGDVKAAIAARCLPVLVRTGNGASTEAAARALGVVRVFDDLSLAVDWLLTR